MSTDSTTAASRPPPKAIGRPGKTTGRDVISSWSFMNVITEPAKDTAPTTMVNAVAASGNQSVPSCMCCSSSSATSEAAPPPTPLNSATICGIWVIWTRSRADGTTDAADGDRAEDQRDVLRGPRRRTTTAQPTTAAAAPIRLPARAVFGPDSPLSARMKQTAQSR